MLERKTGERLSRLGSGLKHTHTHAHAHTYTHTHTRTHTHTHTLKNIFILQIIFGQAFTYAHIYIIIIL